MTQEEKAKAYDIIIQRVTELYETGTTLTREQMEHLFPELAESEDEKIKKAIRLILIATEDEQKDFYSTHRLTRKDCTDWLEEQKERKFDFELIKQAWYMEGYKDREFGKESRWIVKTGEDGPRYEVNPKYGQKLVKEQKPVDYDHEMWKNCEANFEGGKKEVIEHPERYGLQKPAEWSEEEIGHLYTLARYIKSKGYEDDGEFLEAVANKLKSLRPSWKPSEEQMEVFQNTMQRLLRAGGTGKWYATLKSLYEQLKKL